MNEAIIQNDYPIYKVEKVGGLTEARLLIKEKESDPEWEHVIFFSHEGRYILTKRGTEFELDPEHAKVHYLH